MDRCDQIETCKFFQAAMTEMPTAAEMMKKRCCHGDYQSCARKSVLERLGRDHVPASLAPNDHQRARNIVEATNQRNTAVHSVKPFDRSDE